ncbi:MAG: FAD:protein FMN transferase, partial [Clostridia bacterium]|nr:FAD:protein FMN transferase [Clostridia bacterium]
EKYYFVNGTRYSHIIDPKTGSPIQTGVITATIIGGTAADGDAYTTALTCMGLTDAINFINTKLTNCKVVLVYETEQGALQIISNKPQSEINLLDSRYTFAYTLDEQGNIV